MIALSAAIFTLLSLAAGADMAGVATVLIQLFVLPFVGGFAGWAIHRAWRRLTH
jgi:hypothetical protein